MNVRNLRRNHFRIVAPAVLILLCIFHCRTGLCQAQRQFHSTWELGATVSGVQFLHRQRNASEISRYTTGATLTVDLFQRPLPHLAIGVRTELLGIPSAESDARATLGGRTLLCLQFIVPLKSMAFLSGMEAGYSFLYRRVAFDNAEKVIFQGATLGLALGVQRTLSKTFRIGLLVRVSEILGTLHCNGHRCHIPGKGRNPGPTLTIGVRGAFRL